jgi:N-acetylated-alpha-linked acidic dipeptidase
LYFITRTPHVAGTEGDYLMARFVQTEFVQAGIPNVSIDELTVLLNYPKSPPTLQLLEGETTANTDDGGGGCNTSDSSSRHATGRRHDRNKLIYEATLSEDDLNDFDETSDTPWRNLTFHGYSPSGSVRGRHIVYANYGRPQDFDVLEAAGVSVDGRVVLVRYGGCFRGLKVRNAQARGAVAVLIYSDPADDGYGQGTVYPNGPWRPESGIQRGSVQFNSHCAGDPLRADPRYRSVLNISVRELCGVDTVHELIPSVPSLPLSYRDATHLLRNLGGPVAADLPHGGMDFVGGLRNVTYRLGPSHGVVHLHVDNEDVVTTIPNVIGIIPGSLPKDKDTPILIGNHRDAWYVLKE